ncbi:MAG: hypothetical protein WAV98_01970 [Minisyncoccia bacterium]
MQGIEFEEDKDYQGLLRAKTLANTTSKQGFIMKFMEKIGFVDKTTANFVLLGLVAILFGITIFLYAEILTEPAKDWSLDARAIQESQKYQR